MKSPKVVLDGFELACLDPFEATFLQRDVAQYFLGDIKLSPGATVLDVGANIGVFSAQVTRRLAGQVKIWAFEPVPPIFDVLAQNAQILGTVTPEAVALGAAEGPIELTYFPLMSCLSSAHRGGDNLGPEVERVARSILELIRSGQLMAHLSKLPDFLLEPFIFSYVKTRMRPEKYTVPVVTLTSVLARIPGSVDLLKVDVEGAEEAVLAGIGEGEWPRIHQLVLELEKFEGRLTEVRQKLEAKGYRVRWVQDTAQKIGDYGLVYAVRS